MDLDLIQGSVYVVCVVLFVFGLKLMSSPATARKGNLLSAAGMLIALIATLMNSGLDLMWIFLGIAIGTAIGSIAAIRVKMTGMPEMVALLNGCGGLASLLLGSAEYVATGASPSFNTFTAVATVLAIFIGGVTFTGSLIAWAKLSEKISGKPILYPGQQILNAVLVICCTLIAVFFVRGAAGYSTEASRSISTFVNLAANPVFLSMVVSSLIFGVLLVIPIGGADMPVAISLLNSYSGLAACAAGYAIDNMILIVAGALVGASGIVLTTIMCKAMNRSLANVLFSGFGAVSSERSASSAQGEVKECTPHDAYYVLEAASSVVVIPGYGLAVAQAQHAVRELAGFLEANGTQVRYAIHPVAGRMPGHMNVLLAEANIPYELLVEMDSINPQMENTDVAIVIGANDVVNPAAYEQKESPIYGMPIIHADKARTVFVLKRTMATGFAGIENPLFFRDNTRMIFGDAKKTIEAMIDEFKS